MVKVNELVLTREDHGDKLFDVMANVLKVLLDSGYVCKVRADEPGLGIYIIEYDYDNELTSNVLLWVDSEKQYVGDIEEESEEEKRNRLS